MAHIDDAVEDNTMAHQEPNVTGEETTEYLELERLPKEIRFQIFGLLTESIGEIKLVCKSWQQLVNEWNIPVNRPEFLMIDLNEESEQSMSVSVELRNSARTCFLDFWQFAKEASVNSEEPVIEKFPEFSRVSLIISYANTEMMERLRTVISQKTRTLWIGRWGDAADGSPFIDTIKILLKSMKRADTLFATLRYINDQSVQLLTQLSTNCRIPKIVFSFDSGAVTNLRDFLTTISSNIPSIQLTQRNLEHGRNRTFFGDEKIDWVREITEMFESGVRDLNMQNTITFSHDGFMNVEELSRLAQSLATIRRNIKFTTNAGKKLKADFDNRRIQVKNCDKSCFGQQGPYLVVITTLADEKSPS